MDDMTPPRVTAPTTTTTVLHYHADIHFNKFGEDHGCVKEYDQSSDMIPPTRATGIGSRQQVIIEAKGMRQPTCVLFHRMKRLDN